MGGLHLAQLLHDLRGVAAPEAHFRARLEDHGLRHPREHVREREELVERVRLVDAQPLGVHARGGEHVGVLSMHPFGGPVVPEV